MRHWNETWDMSHVWQSHICDMTRGTSSAYIVSHLWQSHVTSVTWLMSHLNVAFRHYSCDRCDMTHVTGVTWLMSHLMTLMSHLWVSHLWHDSCDMTHVTWLVWHDSCDESCRHIDIELVMSHLNMTCLVIEMSYRDDCMCDMTHSHAWHESFTCVTWVIHMCDMSYSHVWHRFHLTNVCLQPHISTCHASS